MIVFDFHSTLSLKSGKVNPFYVDEFMEQLENGRIPSVEIGINDMKTYLKRYKETNESWYDAMKRSKINPKNLMPTIDDVIQFIDFMQPLGYVFTVASMLEEEKFIYDLLYYCFEQKGRISPFKLSAIVSTYGLKETNIKSKNKSDKWPHIEVIMKRNNFTFSKDQITMIDDDIDTIQYMTSIGICSVYATNYFMVQDWNKGCYVPL